MHSVSCFPTGLIVRQVIGLECFMVQLIEWVCMGLECTSPDDTVGDLKKLIAAQTGMAAEQRLQADCLSDERKQKRNSDGFETQKCFGVLQ